MATTKTNKIGRTRIKLAKMLETALTKEYGRRVAVDPADLWSQVPMYATPQWDCASWGGTAYADFPNCNPVSIHVSSWTTMGQVVRDGIGIIRDAYARPWEVEIA